MSKKKTRKFMEFDWDDYIESNESLLISLPEVPTNDMSFDLLAGDLKPPLVDEEADVYMPISQTRSLQDFFEEEHSSDTCSPIDEWSAAAENDSEIGTIPAGKEEEDDDILATMLPSTAPRFLRDYFSEVDESDVLEDVVAPLATASALKSVADKPGKIGGEELSDDSSALLATPKKKDNSKKLTLQDMQNSIADQVPLIAHNGGLYYYNGRTYKAIGNSYELLSLVRSRISTTAFASTSTKQFFDLLVYMKADERLVPVDYQDRLLRSKYMVVLKNGVLDLESLNLLPHTPRLLTFHEFDADYVEDKKPKVFLRFLEQSSGGDAQVVRRTVEAMGYLFSGVNVGKYFFVAGTAPNSGKSTLGLLLQSLIGEAQTASISTHQLDARFALGGTRNRILNIAMDVPKGHLSSVTVSLLKSITGGDPISIEEKYQQPEKIVSGLRFLFGTNYKITVPESDNEDAFWERMVILPFINTIPAERADHMLLDKLLDEKDRIISYCLRSFHNVLDHNCQFSPCAVADQMKAAWRNIEIDTRSWEAFFYAKIEVTGDSNDTVYAMELYNRYKEFCWDHQYEAIPYNNMKNWIVTNIPPGECYAKRIHNSSSSNPRAGFVGIRFVQ